MILTVGPADTTATASVAATTESLRVMTWNICGEAGGATPLDAGYCPYRSYPQLKADIISEVVTRKDINALLLQEICFDAEQEDSHLDLLEQRLHESSPLWEFSWTPMERPDGRTDCRGTLHGTVGVAVAVKGHITEQIATELAPRSATSSQSKLLCVRVEGWRNRLCNLHMPAGKADLSTEVARVLTTVSGDPDVVVGGDFNTSYPDSATGNLDPLYERFNECDTQSYTTGDASNEVTHFTRHATGADGIVTSISYTSSKLDYIFGTSSFSQCDSWTQMSDHADYPTTLMPSGISDHAPTFGTTTGSAAPMPPALRTTVPAATGPDPVGCDPLPYGVVDTRTPRLQAYVSDTDPTKSVNGEFSIWDNTDTSKPQPIVMGGDGSASTSVIGEGTVSVPMPRSLDANHVYGWRVRTVDSDGTASAISPNCHFQVASDAP